MHHTAKGRAIFGLSLALPLSLTLSATMCQAQQQSEDATSTLSSKIAAAPVAKSVTTTGGTKGIVPLFSATSAVSNSVLYQSGTGIGIGRVPAATLDVGGTSIFRGVADFPTIANATAARGSSSYSLRFSSQVYDSKTKKAITPYFQVQTEPVENNTATPGANLHFLYYSGGTAGPADTGFYLNSNGTIHFAEAQKFPAAATVPGPVGPRGPEGPAGPEGRTGATGPAGPAGTLTLPRTENADGKGSYLLKLTNTGTKGGGGIYASGETGIPENKDEVTFAGAGVTGKGGVAANSESASGGTGVAGTGGNSSAAEASAGGTGVTGLGGAGTSRTSKGGAGGDFTGGSSAVGAGNGINAIGGNGNSATQGGNGIYAQAGKNGRYAGEFKGDVVVFGNIYKSGGSFKIDDPEDPANKYLSHSFVESPDMMNLYNGNVVTDSNGDAAIQLPSWFESLNRDFRYQLTPLGQFAQAMVATEIVNGRFTIKTDKPNVKVSWLVTGVRQDAWANAHRIPVEQEKPDAEKGRYLHPELYGHPGDSSLAEPASSQSTATQQPSQR